MSERTLSIIPVLHTETDLGAVGDAVRAHTVQHAGRAAWERKRRAIESLWDCIASWAESVDTQGSTLRVYQDGLPVCGKEMHIVRDLASQGSLNHRVLKRLVERGAELVGTESPELLLEEYERAKAATDRPRIRQDEAAARELLERRDRFIARRIDDTLPAGGHGVLFIGMLHHVEQHLPETICTEAPFDITHVLQAGAA